MPSPKITALRVAENDTEKPSLAGVITACQRCRYLRMSAAFGASNEDRRISDARAK